MSNCAVSAVSAGTHQETLTVDAVLERLLTTQIEDIEEDDEMVTACINRIFSLSRPVKVETVRQRKVNLNRYRRQVEKLKLIPHVEQRTPAWHLMRKSLITASDFAQALGEGKFGTQKQFFQKKCGYEKDVFNYNSPPLKWGTMYEQVAGDIYCRRNNVTMHEFGILRHPTISHIGASPDGITSNGIMVEIKCPYKRKITGEIPAQYYYQIQGQLDVCELNECDYLECEFTELTDMDVFKAFDKEKGVIIEYSTDGSTAPDYVYSPTWSGAGTDMALIDDWINSNIDDTKNNIVLHYWTLTLINVVRVYKNEEFIKEKMAMLADVWAKVLEYQADEALYKREIGGANPTRGNSMTVDLGTKGGKQMAPKLSGYAFIE